MLQDLPALTIELIKKSCSDRSFERGEEYYRNGAIIRPMLHLSGEASLVILTAECEGTSDQNYRVSVFLTKDGISDANCSCPYDWGGYCKHIVALLLVYLNEKEKILRNGEETPSRFHRESAAESRKAGDLQPDFFEIAAKLMAQEKENLVVLFLAMLKKVPGLIQLMSSYIACFQGYFSAFFLPDDEIIKQSYRLFVELAFIRGFVEDEQQKEVLEKLHALKSSAEKKAQQGDFYYAALILDALVFGCLEHYEYLHDKREIFGFVSECISLLQEALSKAELTKEKRQKWLFSIFECRNQIEANYKAFMCSQTCDVSCPIGLEKKLDELILSVCKEEDAPILLHAAKLKKELLDRDKAETIHCLFQRRNLIKFILRLLEIAKRTSDYMKLADAEGEGFLYVQKLIEGKEIDKAMRYIQEKPLNVDEYFPLAEKLESLGLNDEAPVLMARGLQRACESKSAVVYKFAEYFLEKQNLQLALSALLSLPLGGISIEFTSEIRILRNIRKVARHLGRWAETKEKLISKLLAQKKYELLTLIYLDDGEIENAIAALKKFHQKPIGSKNARILSFRRNSLMRKVAKETEKSHPFEAIIIYKQLAETQVAKVDRRSYRRALLYLKKIKHLYTLLGEGAKWQDYIAKLRRQNAQKTAFLEEIEEL